MEIGAYVTIKNREDLTGGVVASIRGDQINVVFDGGIYGWFDAEEVEQDVLITLETEGVLVTEYALTAAEKSIVLAALTGVAVVGTANRRAVVEGRKVSLQRWVRVKDYGGQEFVGCDLYRWIEERKVSI